MAWCILLYIKMPAAMSEEGAFQQSIYLKDKWLYCALLLHVLSTETYVNYTQTTDRAVLLPEGFWHKLNRKMSFNKARRSGEVFCQLNSYMAK